MLLFFRKLHLYYFLSSIFILWVLLWPFTKLFASNTKYYKLLNKTRAFNLWLPMVLSGVFYKLHFEEPLDEDTTYIFCPNHTSYIDIIMMMIIAKGTFHFMGKAELLKNSVISIYFKTIDIPVNRASKMNSLRAYIQAGNNLKKGMSLILYPECKIDVELLPDISEFKEGAFKLAIDHKIKLVPVTFLDNWRIMPDDGMKKGLGFGICRAIVHKPIDTTTYEATDVGKLTLEVRNIIEMALKKDSAK